MLRAWRWSGRVESACRAIPQPSRSVERGLSRQLEDAAAAQARRHERELEALVARVPHRAEDDARGRRLRLDLEAALPVLQPEPVPLAPDHEIVRVQRQPHLVRAGLDVPLAARAAVADEGRGAVRPHDDADDDAVMAARPGARDPELGQQAVPVGEPEHVVPGLPLDRALLEVGLVGFSRERVVHSRRVAHERLRAGPRNGERDRGRREGEREGERHRPHGRRS